MRVGELVRDEGVASDGAGLIAPASECDVVAEGHRISARLGREAIACIILMDSNGTEAPLKESFHASANHGPGRRTPAQPRDVLQAARPAECKPVGRRPQ